LKTGRPGFWIDAKWAKITDQARAQAGLRNDIQPTAYLWLWRQVMKDPAHSFMFWFLGEGGPRIIRTERADSDMEAVYRVIDRLLEDQQRFYELEQWPKSVNTYQCGFCEYWRHCLGKDSVSVSHPVQSGEYLGEESVVEVGGKPKGPEQLKFKFKRVAREKKNP
jgi:hypothetical protein